MNTDAPNNDDFLADSMAGGNVTPLPRGAARKGSMRALQDLDEDLENAPRAATGALPAGDTHDDPGLPPPTDPSGQRPASDRPRGEIWRGCPVKPLGYLGGVYFYLDPLGQMRGIVKHDAQAIMMLFAAKLPRLYHAFPKMVADRKTGTLYRKAEHFEHQLAASAMITACGERGLFNPDGAVRGVGAWTDDDGHLIYHTGDHLFQGGEMRAPDAYQGRIYPAYPPIPHPALAVKDDAAVGELLDTLASWNWTRPDIDPMIVLGMVGVQFLGGALKWRPTFWNTGPRASGKSSFHALLRHLHGDKGLIQSSDATKSGITSRIGHSSLPVAVDELEPGTGKDGSAKETALIELARVASSGGEWMRGSSDQKGASGNVYSTFFFSSILMSGKMTPADISRLVILSLQPLPDGTPPLTLRAETWRARGARIKRVLIDRWPTWQMRLDMWREAFGEHKIDGRNADNYATILAMAQMAQSAALPTADELTGWTAKVARHVTTTMDEIGSDAEEVIVHLLSQEFDPFRRGEKFTIASWLKAAAQRPGAGRRLFAGAADGYEADDAKKANQSLASVGLRMIGTVLEPELFVATAKLQGLKDLFQHSQWASGAWTQSLQRVKGARANQGPRYLDGAQTKGTVIPFSAMPGLMALDGDLVPSASPTHDAGDEDYA